MTGDNERLARTGLLRSAGFGGRLLAMGESAAIFTGLWHGAMTCASFGNESNHSLASDFKTPRPSGLEPMLMIRHEQLHAFQTDSTVKFAEKILPEMKAAYPDAVAGVSDDAFRQRLITYIDRAQSYGLEESRDIVAYIKLTLCMGCEFMQRSAISQVLMDVNIPPHQRMGILLNSLMSVR
ncbi:MULTISPECIES: hypothetical protein [Pseudomonas]|jgi:hypothetical protein|uniref:hypothetical protein n=1 Tax=Pseudomonas TaxID=286 RepID=UPI000BA49F12|nr:MULTISPECIES: hypothetical protein [Pseudomonas]WPN77422.1 hypothetical protein QMK46_13955 [Pseudomonas germanica]